MVSTPSGSEEAACASEQLLATRPTTLGRPMGLNFLILCVSFPASQAWNSPPEDHACAGHGSEPGTCCSSPFSGVLQCFFMGLAWLIFPGEEVRFVLQDECPMESVLLFVH